LSTPADPDVVFLVMRKMLLVCFYGQPGLP
jgi:hypothetical protein